MYKYETVKTKNCQSIYNINNKAKQDRKTGRLTLVQI